MILLSHRGNLNGPIPERENSRAYIDEALAQKYEVEIDIWGMNGKFYLGHDTSQYDVSLDWLLDRSGVLLVHAKNIEALTFLLNTSLRVFYHTNEKHTIINNSNLIWSHDVSEAGPLSIIPMLDSVENPPKNVVGICSDFIARLRNV
jgi:hypothetical protein